MPQSYKIFVRDVPVLFLSSGQPVPEAYKFLPQNFIYEPIAYINDEQYWVDMPGYIVQGADANTVFETFKSKLRIISAAGGIVENIKNELLMIYRRGYWDLPKGKIDAGESIDAAAIREVKEETGIEEVKIIKFKASTYHVYFQDEWILKETFWYDMKYTGSGKLIPQEDEDIAEAIWVNKNEIGEKLSKSYSSIREILN